MAQEQPALAANWRRAGAEVAMTPAGPKRDAVHPPAQDSSASGDFAARVLQLEQSAKPWFLSIADNMRELSAQRRLPPLDVTSRPVPVQDVLHSDPYAGRSRMISLMLHGGVIALLFALGTSPAVRKALPGTTQLFAPLPAELTALFHKDTPHGGGGGGDRSPLPASQGALPKAARTQFTPPQAVHNNLNPQLVMEPAIIAPDANLPNINSPVYGDPFSKYNVPSNGRGSRGGIGDGDGTGVGPGKGPGFGPGENGGYGGDVYQAGRGGVTAPTVISAPEPEYSEEARRAKFQGSVLLTIVVDPDGKACHVRVARSLGMGLDQKAVEAVSKWLFHPGTKDGKPVPVLAQVILNFRLL